MLDADGGPLDMVRLAQASPEFVKLWRRVETRRSVIRSQLYADGGAVSGDEVAETCDADGPYDRYLAACKKRHGRYLQLVELLRSPGGACADIRESIVAEGPDLYGRRMPV